MVRTDVNDFNQAVSDRYSDLINESKDAEDE